MITPSRQAARRPPSASSTWVVRKTRSIPNHVGHVGGGMGCLDADRRKPRWSSSIPAVSSKRPTGSIDTIIAHGKLKETGSCRVLIAAGCLAQRYQGDLLKQLPELDGVVGTGESGRLRRFAGICSRRRNGNNGSGSASLPIYTTQTLRVSVSGGP